MYRYPNPDAITIPTTGPPPFPAQVTSYTKDARETRPSIYPLHNHTAFVDASGAGVTDTVGSHFHRVMRGRVQPDPSDGHYHELTGLAAGAGAPFPNVG